MKKTIALLAFSGIFLISCTDDDPIIPGPVEPTPENYSSGSADFTKYVSVGNSVTAGLSDAALFIDGQVASYPNMLATSFAAAGGGSFSIPLMADNLGGITLGGQAIPGFGNRLFLSFADVDPSDPKSLPSPVPVPGTGSTEISTVLTGPFNNMGVPGATSFHLLAPGYGNLQGVPLGLANPYFARFASSPNTRIIDDALAQSPTFFSLWIGNNDVLGYAQAGGDGVDQEGNIDPSTYSRSDITDPNVFANACNIVLQGLTANGAKGVIANIPDITKLPYFTTVPFDPLDPTNADFGPQIPVLNATFSLLNQVFGALNVPERAIVFSETAASAVVIKDETLSDLSAEITQILLSFNQDPGTAAVVGFLYGQARQANADDLIVLPARSAIATLNAEAFATLQQLGLPPAEAGQLSVNGITYPLEDKWVLTPEEQLLVKTASDKFNTTIETLANAYGLAFFDAEAYYNIVADTGIPLKDGSTVTAAYGTGGGFSLDGIHPSPRGSALLANQFILAIESKYGAALPEVDPLEYTGLYIN
ncbi:MAG: G-D-S-L family lipolytic protein [Flavobacteriaceae bacterium]